MNFGGTLQQLLTWCLSPIGLMQVEVEIFYFHLFPQLILERL